MPYVALASDAYFTFTCLQLSPISRPPGTGASSSLALARPTHVRVSPERTRQPQTTIEETSDASLEEVEDDADEPPRDSPSAANGDSGRESEKNGPLGLPLPPYAGRKLERWRRRTLLPSHAWARTLKSSVLVCKVLSVSRMCTRGAPGTAVAAAALALAVVDTWFDGLGATLAFGAAHVALLAVARFAGAC